VCLALNFTKLAANGLHMTRTDADDRVGEQIAAMALNRTLKERQGAFAIDRLELLWLMSSRKRPKTSP
jgi:hypothetical protein